MRIHFRRISQKSKFHSALPFFAGGVVRPIVPSKTPFAEFIPRMKGSELPQQFAAFVKGLISSKRLVPGDKIIPAEVMSAYLRGQGFPVAGNTLNLGLQKVARDGKILYINGCGLENQGPGYYVFDKTRYSYLKLLQTNPLPVLGKSQIRAAMIRDILQNQIKPGELLPLDDRTKHLLGTPGTRYTLCKLVGDLQKLGFLRRDAQREGPRQVYRVAEKEAWGEHVKGRVAQILEGIVADGFSEVDAKNILRRAVDMKVGPATPVVSTPPPISTQTLGSQIKLGLEQSPNRQKRPFLTQFFRKMIFSGSLPAGAIIEGPFAFTRIAGRRFQGLIYTAMMQLVEDGLLLRPKGMARGYFTIAMPQTVFVRAEQRTRNRLKALALEGYDLNILKPFIEDRVRG